MLFILFKGILLATLTQKINCLNTIDSAAWTKRDTRPKSYFSAPTPNFLRCGKLCERQVKCYGASFDIVQRICHLHDKSVKERSSGVPGKYMFQDVQRESGNFNTNGECTDTQISLPREGDSDGCRDIHAEGVLSDTEQPTSSITVPSAAKVSTSTEQPTITTSVSSATDAGTTTQQPAASTMESSVVATPATINVEETSTFTTESMQSTIGDGCSSTNATDSTLTTTNDEETSTITTESTPATTNDKETSTITTESVIQCMNNQPRVGSKCVCEHPLTGRFCENGPRDCYGHTIYNWTDIYPEDGKGKLRVLCGEDYLYAFVATEHGFTSEFLNRTWLDYMVGFGDIPDLYTTVGGYWLGNENIRRITNGTLSYKLNFYGHVDGLVKVGDYMNFQLSSETEHYTESYTTYSSTDNMDRVLEKDRPFITFDRDENGCAAKKNTGFWFDMDCQIQPPLFGSVNVEGNSKTYTNFWISLIRI